MVSLVGDWLYIVVLSLIFAKQSPEYVALLWLIRALAPLFMGFIVGSVADRFGHKRTAILSDFLRAGVIGLMPFVLDSPLILVLVFLNSCLGPFFSASFNPIIASITQTESRHWVNSILSMIMPLATFVGPLIGVLLLDFHASAPFLAQSASFIISAISLLFVHMPKAEDLISDGDSTSPKISESKLRVILNDVVFSVSYIWSNSVLKGMMVVQTLFILGSTVLDAYEVLFITKTLELGDRGYSLFISIGGILFVISSLVNGIVSKYVSLAKLYFYGLMITLIGNLFLALSVDMVTLLVGQSIIAVGATTLFTTMATLYQTIIPVHLLGRISGIQTILPTAASSISIAISAALLNIFSIRSLIVSGAIVTALTIIPAYMAFISMRNAQAQGQSASL